MSSALLCTYRDFWMLFRTSLQTKLNSCSFDLVPSSCTVIAQKKVFNLWEITYLRFESSQANINSDLQTSTSDSSMMFLCFRYMGQTWPSNRPGGSGTVQFLELGRDATAVALCLRANLQTSVETPREDRELPPPLFAFFIWDGNEVALIQHVDQRPARDRRNLP